MSEHSNGSITLPRDFRFRYQDALTTPEPLCNTEPCQPSPPRQRLKLRRRVVSSLRAPTEQFLQSVAAADFPLPTIEYPENLGDSKQLDIVDEYKTELLVPQEYDHLPKTPTPENELRPDWYTGAIPEYYYHRPSSSHSVESDLSHESTCSNGHFSRLSEDESCMTPDTEYSNPFIFPTTKANKEKQTYEGENLQIRTGKLNANIRSKARNNAPWSSAQTAHLWATYLLYLQDPTVTPLRIGASLAPPEGVCHRVAREARRSWKGPKINQSRSLHNNCHPQDDNMKIPQPEKKNRIYAKWPHSSSATRNNLRNLCRQRDASSVSRFHHYQQSRSQTPFSKSTPCRPFQNFVTTSQESNWNVKDISISLSLSTATSMQPDGPLATLTHCGFKDNYQSSRQLPAPLHYTVSGGGSRIPNYRLGSPFSHSYGPSSSRVNKRPTLSLSAHLGSPVQFDNSIFTNETPKRRQYCYLPEKSTMNDSEPQPIIPNEQPLGNLLERSRRVRKRGFSLGNESHTTQALQSALDLTSPRLSTLNLPQNLQSYPSGTHYFPRLRSPFAESGISNTYPRINFSNPNSPPINSETISHQTRHSIENFDFREKRLK
ncbi:hypothetical protein GcC1_221004 [Golovinomyces cichoracearum]|uniref:Uncharacterized protein n=1 Tax=Golovinomyces cichoracearum TaxID=62708 RepID=A0A420H7F3_9PEZI|nr:hypothetical protein GcC1_221004 [Golovinomyces cichoracearum]